MALPLPTEGLTLQDVVDELGSDNLITCFANADDNLFDPAYEGSQDRLSNFKNYGASAPTFCDYIDELTVFNSGVSSIVVGTPVAAQVGDLLVLAVRVQSGITTSATPSGWTHASISPAYSTTYPNIVLYYKIATAADLDGGASEDVTVNLTGTVGAYVYLTKMVIRTSALGTQFGADTFLGRSTSSSASPNITLDKTNSIVVAIGDVGASTAISNTGTGWVTVSNTNYGTSVSDRIVQQKDINGGASPLISFTWSGSSPYTSFMFEIL